MGQILHGSATTAQAIRAALQRSKAPLKELSEHYGLNPKTVAKWKKRAFVHDAPMGPKNPNFPTQGTLEIGALDPKTDIVSTRHSLNNGPQVITYKVGGSKKL